MPGPSPMRYAVILFLSLSFIVRVFPQDNAAPGKENRELSLQHFLDGSLHDQKGEYAQGILEYQEALRYSQDPAIYHAMAKDYAILGKNERAIESGAEAVKRDPDNRIYRETLAEIYINALEYDKALGEFEQIVKLDSSGREDWSNMAHLTQMKNPDKALSIYRKIIERFGPDQDSYFQMARIYESQNKLAEATDAISGMLKLDPGNFELEKSLGDLYLRQDSVDAALRIYTGLVEQHPEQVEVRAAIAHADLVKQDYQHAAEQFDIVLKRDTLSADDQISFGRVFVTFIQKDSLVAPYALTMFKKIQGNYPDDWRPYLFIAMIEQVLRDDSAALVNFSKVRAMEPSNPDSWMGIAGVFYDRGNLDSTIAILDEAKRVIPDEFRVYFLLGLTYQRKHQLPDAAVALERAVQIRPKDMDAMTSLALVYDELHRKDDSDSLYERALRIDPHNHLALNNYGYSLSERGRDLERAMRMSKEALKLQPDNQSYLDTYGWILFQMQKYEDAERYLRKAAEMPNPNPVIIEHLGDVNFRLSRHDRAMELWKKALELDSTNELLRQKIQKGSL
ncbi:MAG TPA: tetratricopeptide repeat protein [Bacteroidota bacterium]|nr:tetratricopeptide repeat protein [Bacteroidota bacterium]